MFKLSNSLVREEEIHCFVFVQFSCLAIMCYWSERSKRDRAHNSLMGEAVNVSWTRHQWSKIILTLIIWISKSVFSQSFEKDIQENQELRISDKILYSWEKNNGRVLNLPISSFSPSCLCPLFFPHHATLTWATCVIPMSIGSHFQRSEMCVSIQPKSQFPLLPHWWLFPSKKEEDHSMFSSSEKNTLPHFVTQLLGEF